MRTGPTIELGCTRQIVVTAMMVEERKRQTRDAMVNGTVHLNHLQQPMRPWLDWVAQIQHPVRRAIPKFEMTVFGRLL